MFAGYHNFIQAVRDLARVFQMGTGNRCHSNNCIERRTDIMAYPGEEFAFGGVCMVCSITGFPSNPDFPFFFALAFCNILFHI